ncbi:hypothetical protein [Wolbachia endosymbiont (group E) of Neria commutata]|uniref:hypothetical protein n=1 Tax=Wolbachia endosymbiont (group E) of Neria commutata TaxID=3066149 RepID=UPI003132BCF7
MKQESIIGYTQNMEELHEGEKIYADITGKKRERISMTGGWIKKNFIAPMTFTGGCDKDVFNA